MRRTKKEIGKVKLRIVELKKQGKNYEQIRRATGAGYNTISGVVKGFTGRYCVKCGETNAQVLQEHHPDRVNQPDLTLTFCANHHDEITRKQAKERAKGKAEPVSVSLVTTNTQIPVIPGWWGQNYLASSFQNLPAPETYLAQQSTVNFTSQGLKMGGLFLGGATGLWMVIAAKKRDAEPKDRIIPLVIAGLCFWQFYRELKKPKPLQAEG